MLSVPDTQTYKTDMNRSPPPISDEADAGLRKPAGILRRGWTTGACATAATRAALEALLNGHFPDPVTITLPKGETPAFALAHERAGDGFAEAGIIKDAGDDPDVTHGAMIIARVERGTPGAGLCFKAGDGVGTVTKAGLPVAPGEAAVNPVPRAMMQAVVDEVCAANSVPADITITIRVPGGQALAEQTWNPRLGIIGGISILGTTGIVHPFSCAAWIHSIHRGVDVARAAGLTHIMASTGSTSEATGQSIHHLPDIAMIDMGDFAGGLLKYLRAHPVPRLTITGGFAKLAKLAQGALDLHSGRSQLDMDFLAGLVDDESLKATIGTANTGLEALSLARDAGFDLATPVARRARQQALSVLDDAPVDIEIIAVARDGGVLATAGFGDDA